MVDDTEPIAERSSQKTCTRCCADQRKLRQIQADRARRRAFSDHDINRKILHRWVKNLLDLAVQAVDLINKQDVASCRLLRIAAISPGFSIAGPLVTFIWVPISFAMMPASVVFPSPGGRKTAHDREHHFAVLLLHILLSGSFRLFLVRCSRPGAGTERTSIFTSSSRRQCDNSSSIVIRFPSSTI